jgi:hypothetical protein
MCGEECKLIQYFGVEDKAKEHLKGLNVDGKAIFLSLS